MIQSRPRLTKGLARAKKVKHPQDDVTDISETPRGSRWFKSPLGCRPDALGVELDAAAAQLSSSRADIIRQAIEYCLDDIEDLRCGVAALKVPADPVLHWAEVRLAEGFSRSE